jgi:hypothetical protein
MRLERGTHKKYEKGTSCEERTETILQDLTSEHGTPRVDDSDTTLSEYKWLNGDEEIVLKAIYARYTPREKGVVDKSVLTYTYVPLKKACGKQ